MPGPSSSVQPTRATSAQRRALCDQVLDHRSHQIHGLESLVHWVTREQDFTAWEPAGSFLQNYPDAWLSLQYRLKPKGPNLKWPN